jgi:hypothetical protein
MLHPALKWRLAATLGVGLAAMAVTGYRLHPGLRPQAPDEFRFAHCPKCGLELRYSPLMAGKRCPRCAPDPPVMVPTAEPTGGQEAPSPDRDLKVALSAEGVLLLGAVVYILYHPPAFKEDTMLYTRCAACKQRLRYRAGLAGETGRCPRCKRPVLFPSLD